MPSSVVAKSDPWRLVGWSVAGCLIIFALLQVWRPCYFLTDDNLSGCYPEMTDVGRALKTGHSPFISHYLFGGDYNRLRDIDELMWDPFLTGPALLSDTVAKFWMLDVAALMFLLVTTSGFALLAWKLREEFSLTIPDRYLVFYTLSYTFCSYILVVGPSWIVFLNNQGCLPWLAFALLDRKLLRATVLIVVVTAHEILTGYSALTISSSICLTIFAVGVACLRRSVQPLFAWFTGNFIAVLVLSPMLLVVLDGFAHSKRILGVSMSDMVTYNIDYYDFPFSYFFGNWSEIYAKLTGDPDMNTIQFPYPRTMLCCAAAWCLIPALLDRTRWKTMHVASAGLILFLGLVIVRPMWLAEAMHHIPVIRSMRWPFREALQLIFFLHVFLVLRFPVARRQWQPIFAVLGLLVFLAPLPFIRVPTLNSVKLDRELLFSGDADKYWAQVKAKLGPGDQIVPVMSWPFFGASHDNIPYTLAGTADYPSLFQFHSATGYSPTSPTDQIPIKVTPAFWFGSFGVDQIPDVYAAVPNVWIMQVVKTHPLTIILKKRDGTTIDLTPLIDQSYFNSMIDEPNLIPAHSDATKTTP